MRIIPFIALLLAGGCMFGCSRPSDGSAFEKKATWAAKSFPAPVITQGQLREAEDVLLVDTRTEEEFAVSHLPGAINWADYMDSPPPAAVQSHSREGKPVVFYCSIGYRSGDAAVRAAKVLDPNAKLFNLRGGIFQWANEDGTMEGGDVVHGYDEEWGELLKPGRRADPKQTP